MDLKPDLPSLVQHFNSYTTISTHCVSWGVNECVPFHAAVVRLLSEKPKGFLQILDPLYDTTRNRDLKMNVLETKIVVFFQGKENYYRLYRNGER